MRPRSRRIGTQAADAWRQSMPATKRSASGPRCFALATARRRGGSDEPCRYRTGHTGIRPGCCMARFAGRHSNRTRARDTSQNRNRPARTALSGCDQGEKGNEVMRQRTKVAEWWERRNDVAGVLLVARYSTKALACSKEAKKRGTLHHVTRYRLAPLVRLRWVPYGSSCAPALDNMGKSYGAYFLNVSQGRWYAGQDAWQDCATVAEAKAACAAALRELGYRVKS